MSFKLILFVVYSNGRVGAEYHALCRIFHFILLMYVPCYQHEEVSTCSHHNCMLQLETDSSRILSLIVSNELITWFAVS